MAAEENRDDLRPLLFSIAYRMLGRASDAEDVVQEAYLRLHQSEADGIVIRSDKAFLTTIATRVAIDQLRSARSQRETYYGPWLPEPLLTSPDPDGAAAAEQADSLTFTFLVLRVAVRRQGFGPRYRSAWTPSRIVGRQPAS